MPNASASSTRKDTLLTAVAPLIWGSTYIVTSELLPPHRPFTAAVLRVLPAGILLLLLVRQLPRRSEWLRILVLGALNIGAFQALLFVAALRLPGGLAAVVGAIQPLLVMALAWRVDHRRPSRQAMGAGLLGVLGMAALLLSPQTVWEPIGIAAAFAGAGCMAAGSWLTQRWAASLPVLSSAGWQLLVGGLMLLPLALMYDAPLPALSLVQYSGYAYLCLAGTLLAYVLWFRGIERLSPLAVSSLGLLSPVVAVVLGWTLLGQGMGGIALLGMLAVLSSVLAVQRAAARQA